MAKKKADASAAASKPAKKSSSSSSSHAKSASATPTTGGTARQIDTSVAANVAAAMIAGKVAPSSSANASSVPKKESAAFKQLKAGLNKPSAGALGGVFGNVNQQKKSHLPHGGGKQVGHNQTFGSDAARTGVPRRTPG
jgi:hypothetical protein